MKIETKFNINNTVYPVRYFNDDKKWRREKDFIVEAIILNKHNEIQYFDGLFYYLQENCFATKEEAQKECDRRNNG